MTTKLYSYGTKVDLGDDFYTNMICQVKPAIGMLIDINGNYHNGKTFKLPISERKLRRHVIQHSKGCIKTLPETFIISSYNFTTK